MSQQPAQLQQLIEPAVESLGYELVGVEYRGGATNGLLRIYIDHEDGITVDDCQKVSHQLSGLLDVEDPIQGHYALEVSSPGLDRPLVRPEDFRKRVGATVKLKLRRPDEAGRRNFTGSLMEATDDGVVVEVDKERFSLPYTAIERARLVPKF